MPAEHHDIIAWVAREILPHEGLVRNWLRRRWGHALEVDDVLQEAYCRLAELESVAHIRNGRSYFFTTVQAVAIDTLRAAKVANAARMTEIEWEYVMDDGPTPDRVAEDGQAWRRLRTLLAGLPPLCRQVIELRRLEGLSQAETARRLGVTEHVVENHVTRGVRRLLKAMAEPPAEEQEQGEPGWTRPTRQTQWTSRRPGGRRASRTGR